jgi:hypothetical protein
MKFRFAPLLVCALTAIAAGMADAKPKRGHGNVAAKSANDKKPKDKPSKPNPKSAYSVDANTPGTDSDEWLTADAVLGGADRIEGNEAAKDLVAFTFDDGPDKNTTPAVLDALERYNIPAAFFIVTQRILGKHGEIPRQLLDREFKAGHLIGSHSVTHHWAPRWIVSSAIRCAIKNWSATIGQAWADPYSVVDRHAGLASQIR